MNNIRWASLTRNVSPTTAGTVILVLLLGTLNILSGVEFTDTGFVSALGWRVFLGQTPGLDFDYVRPPLSAYLWSVPFHLTYDYVEILTRLFVFFQKIVFGALCGLVVNSFCGWRLGFFIGAASAIYAIHNIPLMPWHTMDGILMAAAGIFLFSRGHLSAAVIAFFMATLTKQSFYPIALISVVMVFHAKHELKQWRFWTLLVAPFIGYFLLACGTDFFKSTGSAGSIGELVDTGFMMYLSIFKIRIILFFVVIAFFVYVVRGGLLDFLVLMPALATIFYYKPTMEFISLPKGPTHFAFVISAFLFFRYCQRHQHGLASWVHDKRALVASMLLATAWMSAISWGYTNHVFAYGMILSSAALTIDKKKARFFLLSLAICAFIFLTDRLVAPYRSPSIFSETFSKIENGPYAGIYADATAIRKIEELGILNRRFPGITTLPSMPQASILVGRMPTLRSDWKMDAEYPSWTEVARRRECCRYFAVEKDFRVLQMSGKYGSSLLKQITNHGKIVETGRFFDVYIF